MADSRGFAQSFLKTYTQSDKKLLSGQNSMIERNISHPTLEHFHTLSYAHSQNNIVPASAKNENRKNRSFQK
jgi:hypothetical protein